ncbi:MULTISPECIES: hypothetical protein [unclassified Streptomyces]|uniref:hypothetical protein n=1 Tax=unclassified Streptomyces TaxID=2593676 RepID=UPI0033E8F659
MAALVAGCGGGTDPSGTADGGTAGTQEVNPAGDIPDNQAFVTYRPPAGGFTVEVPEGWSRTTSGDTVVFTDKLNRIEIVSASSNAGPTTQSVTSQVVPALRQKVPGFALGKVSTVSRKAGSVVLLTYQGDSGTNAVTGKAVHDAFERYAFHQQGREVDLTLSGPVKADNVDPWRIVSDSLRWQ